MRKRPNFFIVQFQDLNSCDSVKKLVCQSAYVKKTDLPSLGPKNFYAFELVGMDVVAETGQHFGQVQSLDFNGAQQVLRTSSSWQIPFVQSEIVLDVSREKKLITVDFEPLVVEP